MKNVKGMDLRNAWLPGQPAEHPEKKGGAGSPLNEKSIFRYFFVDDLVFP
jgi:hypothetical protein